MSVFICSWTVCHVTWPVCFPLLHLWLLLCKQQMLLKVKDIWYVICQHPDVFHTLPVFLYSFFLQSPQAVEWQLEGHLFSDACCLWTGSADELILEWKVKGVCYYMFMNSMPCHCTYLSIYIFVSVVISDPQHTECSNLTEARWA